MFSKGFKTKASNHQFNYFFPKSFKLGMFDYVYAKELILGKVVHSINYRNFDRLFIRSKFQDYNKKSIREAILISQSERIAQQNGHLS